jgi:hypothetical protein
MDFDQIGKELLVLSEKVWMRANGIGIMNEFLSRYGIKVYCTGSSKLGNCYYATYYTAECEEYIPDKFIDVLRDAKLFGYGQSWSCNGTEKREDGKWIVNAVDFCDSSG